MYVSSLKWCQVQSFPRLVLWKRSWVISSLFSRLKTQSTWLETQSTRLETWDTRLETQWRYSKFSSFEDRVESFEFWVTVNLHLTSTVEGFHSLCTADSISHSASTESGSEFSSVNETWKPCRNIGTFRRYVKFFFNLAHNKYIWVNWLNATLYL